MADDGAELAGQLLVVAAAALDHPATLKSRRGLPSPNQTRPVCHPGISLPVSYAPSFFIHCGCCHLPLPLPLVIFGLAENSQAGATARARSPICTSASSSASLMGFSEPQSSDSGSMASIAAWLTFTRGDNYRMIPAIVNVIGKPLLATSLRDT